MAFPLLGYVFGLSGVQCLFFVLLLLKPKVPRQATCMPQGCRTLLNFGMETFAVFMLRASLNLVSTTRDGILHSLLQTCVVVLPLLSQLEMVSWHYSPRRLRDFLLTSRLGSVASNVHAAARYGMHG